MAWKCYCPRDSGRKLDLIVQKIDKLQALVFSQVRPDCVGINLISERMDGMASLLTYEAHLPAVPPGDVATQKLEVLVNGTAQPVQDLAKDATVATFEVLQDASVELRLSYVDDGGNASAFNSQTFVAADTIGPNLPGPFGEITLVSEREE